MHTKDIIIGVVIGAVVFGTAGYAAGKKLATPARQFTGQFRGAPGAGGAGPRGGNFIGGEIIAKDETSITLKEQNGSTKIVLITPSVQVSKFAAGESSDLMVGASVMVTGAANSDGSLTAQTIQLRPAGAQAPRMRTGQ